MLVQGQPHQAEDFRSAKGWRQLRQAGPTPAQIAAKWFPYLTKLRAGLMKLPISSVQIVGGLGAVRVVFTSEAEIKAAVIDCVEPKGVNFGWVEQLACWFEATKKNVAQMGTLLGQLRILTDQFAGAVYPPTVTDPSMQALRKSQLEFLDLNRKFIKALEGSLAGWSRLLAGAQETISYRRTYQTELFSLEASHGGYPEFDRYKTEYLQDNLQLLNKIYLPLLDTSLYELKAVQGATDIAIQALGRMSQLAQFVPEYQDLLKKYIEHLSTSHRKDGLFDGILRFFFGEEPGKKIAMIVIGTVVAVGLVTGAVILARRAIAKAA